MIFYLSLRTSIDYITQFLNFLLPIDFPYNESFIHNEELLQTLQNNLAFYLHGRMLLLFYMPAISYSTDVSYSNTECMCYLCIGCFTKLGHYSSSVYSRHNGHFIPMSMSIERFSRLLPRKKSFNFLLSF